MKKEEYTRLFIALCSLNITFLLISNIVTVKTINIFGLIFTVGDLLFPFTYILNDIFTEVYGFNKAKFVIWISFFCNLIMVIIFGVAIWFPEDKSFTMQIEFFEKLCNLDKQNKFKMINTNNKTKEDVLNEVSGFLILKRKEIERNDD